MKQVKSIRFFLMGVWSLRELLLECQRAIFPRARCSDVQEAFRDVGGVARSGEGGRRACCVVWPWI